MSWALFNEIYLDKRSGNHPFDVSMSDSNKTEEDYQRLFSEVFVSTYNKFVSENRKAIEAINNNFVIDFEGPLVFPDYSGFAAFWVQPTNLSHFNPKSGPFEKILIEGIKFEINWFKGRQIVDGIEKLVFQYEICGWFHPEKWGGRNNLDYSPISKITFCGFSRIVCEKFEFNDRAVNRAINQDFACHFYKCLTYYFL